MSKTNQSLITAYKNNDNNIVLKYGNFNNCNFDNLDIETIVINKDDLISVLKVLAAATFLEEVLAAATFLEDEEVDND